MKKKTAGIITILVMIFFSVLILNSLTLTHTAEPVDKNSLVYNLTKQNFSNSSSDEIYKLHDNNFQLEFSKKAIKITVPQEFEQETAIIPLNKLLFHIRYIEDADHQLKSIQIGLKPNMSSTYGEIGFIQPSKKIAYVYPTFTQAAYSIGGFYDYYTKNCDSKCLTISILNDTSAGGYSASARAALRLSLLNYSSITDVDIDKNPDILKKYDKIILLHNEYVTKREFDAITSHPNVFYLYANALYAEVQTNYSTNTITLVKGHGYPQPEIKNGFNWKYDNSQYEYDIQCDNWTLKIIPNGKMVNCYPAFRLYYDESLWQTMKQ